MEGIKKNANIAANIAKAIRNLFVVGIVGSIVGAVLAILMAGFINMYYQDPEKLATAAGSLNADMGFFNVIKMANLTESGLYAQYFAVQLICCAVLCAIYFFLFKVLHKNLSSIRDNGYAFDKYSEKKTKNSYIAIVVLLVLFQGMGEGIIVGLILCGLFLVTKARYIED